MVLFALHNAYGKGFIPSEPKSCSTEQALTFAGQACFVYSKTNGYCPDSYGLLYSSKILNNVPYGKIYETLWENRIILKGETWVSLMGKRFPYVKTLNPLYCNRQSAGKVLGT